MCMQRTRRHNCNNTKINRLKFFAFPQNSQRRVENRKLFQPHEFADRRCWINSPCDASRAVLEGGFTKHNIHLLVG